MATRTQLAVVVAVPCMGLGVALEGVVSLVFGAALLTDARLRVVTPEPGVDGVVTRRIVVPTSIVWAAPTKVRIALSTFLLGELCSRLRRATAASVPLGSVVTLYEPLRLTFDHALPTESSLRNRRGQATRSALTELHAVLPPLLRALNSSACAINLSAARR